MMNPIEFDSISVISAICRYEEFLQDYSLNSLEELIDILCHTYRMKFVQMGFEICSFRCTNFSDPLCCIVQLFDGILLQYDNNVQGHKPIYFQPYTQPLQLKDIYQFPLSITHLEFYSVDCMVLFKVVYIQSQWRIFADIEGNRKIYISPSQCALIFTECCVRYNFEYDKMLNQNNVYLFYIRHQNLMPLHQSCRPQIHLFRVYSRQTYDEVTAPTLPIPDLTLHIIPTKYDLHAILEAPSPCSFIIESKEHQQRYQISSVIYTQLLRFCPIMLYNVGNENYEYEVYLKIKKEFPKQKQGYFLKYFHLQKLDSVFEQLIVELYDEYVDKYVNKDMSGYDVNHHCLENKLEILYKIHFVHLQTNVCILENDVQRIYLYMFDNNIAINLLKQFHKLLVGQVCINANTMIH